jgi:hypothetical protein
MSLKPAIKSTCPSTAPTNPLPNQPNRKGKRSVPERHLQSRPGHNPITVSHDFNTQARHRKLPSFFVLPSGIALKRSSTLHDSPAVVRARNLKSQI